MIRIAFSSDDVWFIDINTGSFTHTIKDGHGQPVSISYSPSDLKLLAEVLLQKVQEWESMKAAAIKQDLWKLLDGK